MEFFFYGFSFYFFFLFPKIKPATMPRAADPPAIMFTIMLFMIPPKTLEPLVTASAVVTGLVTGSVSATVVSGSVTGSVTAVVSSLVVSTVLV